MSLWRTGTHCIRRYDFMTLWSCAMSPKCRACGRAAKGALALTLRPWDGNDLLDLYQHVPADCFFLKQLPRMTRMYHTHLNMFFFQPVPFFQVHLDTLQVRWQNHRLTGAVQLQGRLSKGARGLQRTKLWTLQSSQLQNQISIDSRPKLTNTSVRYQRMQSCTLHSARNRCSSG